VAQDGIAPWLTVTTTGDPALGGWITVTATATENLTDAYLFWGVYPQDFPPEKPLPIYNGTEPEEWAENGWVEMGVKGGTAYYEW
jgi:hypothetical protein